MTTSPTPAPTFAERTTERALTVLAALEADGPTTPDAFTASRGWYINSWAPTFTHLRQHGFVARTGDREGTSHGATAHVVAITDRGRGFLRNERPDLLHVWDATGEPERDSAPLMLDLDLTLGGPQ